MATKLSSPSALDYRGPDKTVDLRRLGTRIARSPITARIILAAIIGFAVLFRGII